MNLDGPVRVASTAGAGSAEVKLSFDNWKGVKVAPTTHAVTVDPAKPGPKAEPVARELIATLPHPDRQAAVYTVKFSTDGTRLLTAAHRSGIVQVWDWAQKKELRRIDTPPAKRPTLNFTAITPDWKTLYVPFETRKVTTLEKDGKPIQRLEESGRIGVWDLTTGKELLDLKPPEGAGPIYAPISPDGKYLLSLERHSFTAGQAQTASAWAWDLQTGARRKLYDGFDYPQFSPNGKTVAYTTNDPKTKVNELKLLDFATGKELASLPCPAKDTLMLGGAFSPDGSVVLADLRGPKDSPPVILFLDATTLAERGRFTGEPDKDGRGWISTFFTPDGKTCLLLDMAGKAHVWDVSASKVTRTFEVGAHSWQGAVSPDGKTWALVWTPPSETENARNPDPHDLPQPRITLFDLVGAKPPRTLIAPHGYIGALAFSPNSQTLALGTSGAVRIFDLSK